MRKFLLLIALIISGLGLNAQSVGDETIINYDGYSLKFTVTNVSPAECSVICSTYPATYTAITIPSTATIEGVECSVTSIGYEAFKNCSLTNIEIPSGVTSIGSYAFYHCLSLTSIEIPSGVTSIGESAFFDCDALASVSIGANSQLTSIGNYTFRSCSSLTSIEIPSNVTSIGNWAFYECHYLESVTFGENSQLTSIGERAFSFCSRLTSIEIPSSVTSIGDYAFSSCSMLYGIRCHAEAVPNTGNYVFNGSIKNIQVPAASVELYESVMPWNRFNITEIYPYIPGDVAIIDYTNYSLKFTVTNLSPAECEVTCSTKPTVPTAVEIPSTVEFNGTDVNVTTIKSDAFTNCTNLKSITIPSSIDSIGYSGSYSAFSGCSNLETVTFAENSQLTSIPYRAFYQCSSLTSIEIPSGVTSIERYAFSYCSSLTSIEIPSGVTSIGEYAFYNCDALTSIEIPSSVTSIGNAAFYNCSSLESVTFGENSQLTLIDNSAFSYCSSLTSIEIPSSVASIGENAFYNCSSLYGIRCHAEAVPTTGSNVFYNCSKIRNIQVPAASVELYKAASPWKNYNITEIYPYYIGDVVTIEYEGYSLKYTIIAGGECDVAYGTKPTSPTAVEIPSSVKFNEIDINVTTIKSVAFRNCTNLTSITIPSSIDSIGYNSNSSCSAFSGCSNLETVTFGENSQLTSIPYRAFYQCSSLTSIEIPSGVTSIGERAFYQCSSLTSIEIPNGVTSIGSSAFYSCSNLERVSLPNTLISIGNSAFNNCDAMVSVNIPNSLETMGVDAYASCDNLIKVTFEDNSKLTSISSSAFSSCYALKTVTFGDNSQLTSIGSDAFYSCDALTSIEIPSGVTSIGGRVFSSCNDLENVTFAENSQLTSIGNYAFNYCSSLTSIEIPSSVASIGDNAFYNCSSLKTITFAENSQLTSIGTSAFIYCSRLESIDIPSGVTEIKKNTFENSGLLEVKLPASVKYIRNFAFQNCQILESVVLAEESQLESIGDLAFNNCKKLYQMEIPRGVNYIGYLTFENCSSLIIIESHAETVPQTDNEAFKSCPENMRISVPQASLAAYQATEPWNYFTLVTEIIQHDIAVSLNLEDAGTIEGDGTYFEGEEVTLTAVATQPTYYNGYENYTFAYWSENGAFVSDEAEYTFVAEADRNLVANFMTDNHWNPNTNQSAYNATIFADLQLEGVSADNINIEIGAFCGEELRGSARIQYFEAINDFLYQIVVYGENNDYITFKLYDHNTQEEMDYMTLDYITFVENGTFGNLDEPMEINFMPTPKIFIEIECNIPEACDVEGEGYYEQGDNVTIRANHVDGFIFKEWTLNGEVVSTNSSYTFTAQSPQRYIANYEYAHERILTKGWNWYSTYMILEGIDGLNTIQAALGTSANQIKGQEAFETYELGQWIGALEEASTDEMYMIDLKSNQHNLIIVGTIADPQNYPIEIKNNWNWISYPVKGSMSISEALSSFTPQHGDYFKSQTTFSQYYEGSGWLGALQTLESGKGYMYQNTSGEVKTLVYPTPSSKAELVANITTENNYWSVNETKYPTNMNIIAVVESNGEELSDYEVGAFCEGECRGSARPIYIEALDRYMIFMTVFGDGNEEISFRLYDVLEGEEHAYTSNESMVFGVNSIIGSIGEPYILHFGILGVEENISNTINVYPNPAGINSEIYLGTNCEKVEIYNAVGVKIAEYEDVSKLEGIGTAGVYVIKMHEGNDISYSRIVVR